MLRYLKHIGKDTTGQCNRALDLIGSQLFPALCDLDITSIASRLANLIFYSHFDWLFGLIAPYLHYLVIFHLLSFCYRQL